MVRPKASTLKSPSPKLRWRKDPTAGQRQHRPMPKQNLHGEMSGQGMEFPSGSKVDETGKITLVKVRDENNPAAKPRFCVACDYIDIMGGGFWEYFRAVGNGGTFEMKPYWQKIHPKLSENNKVEMIESVALYLVPGKLRPISAVVKSAGGVIKIDFQGTLKKKLDKDYSNGAIFLSIKFNGTAFNGLLGFNHYDFKSPWNIQVGIYSGDLEVNGDLAPHIRAKYKNDPAVVDYVHRKKKQILKNMGSWEIRRHEKFGEIPSFRYRKDRYRSEYDTKLDLDS